METAIEIITDTQIKRKIVGICDKAFMHGITIRKNYEEIFQKIDQNAVFIAAVIDKNYVGYAALYANNHESRIAYISMIGVVQDMQRMHIGSRLLKRCIEVWKFYMKTKRESVFIKRMDLHSKRNAQNRVIIL